MTIMLVAARTLLAVTCSAPAMDKNMPSRRHLLEAIHLFPAESPSR